MIYIHTYIYIYIYTCFMYLWETTARCMCVCEWIVLKIQVSGLDSTPLRPRLGKGVPVSSPKMNSLREALNWSSLFISKVMNRLVAFKKSLFAAPFLVAAQWWHSTQQKASCARSNYASKELDLKNKVVLVTGKSSFCTLLPSTHHLIWNDSIYRRLLHFS